MITALLFIAVLCFILGAARVEERHVNFIGVGLFLWALTVLLEKL